MKLTFVKDIYVDGGKLSRNGANFGQHPLGIERSRFAGIKKVIPKTTLGLRSKKHPLAELPPIKSEFSFYLCHLYAFTNIIL